MMWNQRSKRKEYHLGPCEKSKLPKFLADLDLYIIYERCSPIEVAPTIV